MRSYKVKQIKPTELCEVDFSQGETGQVDQVRTESSGHHPPTRFTLLHDTENLYLRFDVDDQYVKAVHTGFHSSVCKDSCVEFFVRPVQNKGYLNFEINAGGTLLLSYIENWTRTPDGFKKFQLVPEELCSKIEIFSSLPHLIEPEIVTPLKWHLAIKIPFCVIEEFTGKVSCEAGSIWRGNFYKCADATSHPHWISWSPVKELNFHAPEDFGRLCF